VVDNSCVAHPSGLVTLLFTDIEGSTRLWEDDPDTMTAALARHDEVLREHIEAGGGYVFKTVGDAFNAVFADAADATVSVLAAQRAIETEPWPTTARIRVRMALHSGVCVERDGDYFGPVVNRAARLLAVGHGGQILLSTATMELAQDRLPDEVRLLPLGTHRLKDLSQPEHVFQLCAEGLPESFATLRSLDDPMLRHNLPHQATAFVGRAAELIELRSMIDGGARVTTLIGAGGVGKTRLALQVAADLVDGTGEGVWLVELASLTEPDQVARSVAAVFDIHDQAGQSIIDALVDALAGKYLMLLLDNAEHLLEPTAKLVDVLVRSCPRVSVLVTSRERLGIGGEHVFRTPSLSMPPRSAQSHAQLAHFESVQLFVERAGLARSGFRLDDADPAALAELCTLLDGIPLAIELAAARVSSMTVTEIRDRLGSRFQLLTAGRHQTLARHQTLEALIEWSYGLLARDEQVLLSRLGVFVGGWTLDAACTVCSDAEIDPDRIVHLLGALVDKSLVQAESDAESTRYRLLETVRRYSCDRLAALGDAEPSRTATAHRAYFLDLAERAEPELHGPAQVAWLDCLEADHDNLRAALAGYAAEPGSGLPALRLALALQWFWEVRAHYAEGSAAVETILTLPELQEPTPHRARALNAACHVAARLTTTERSEARAVEAMAIGRSQGDSGIVADAAYHLYWRAITRAKHGDALRHAEDGLAAAIESGEPRLIARHHMARGISHGELAGALIAARDTPAPVIQRNVDQARADMHRALATSRDLGDHERVICALYNICEGEVAWGTYGDKDALRTLLEEAVPLARRTRNPDLVTQTAVALAELKIRDQDWGAARDLLVEQMTEDYYAGRWNALWILFLALVAAHADCIDHERTAVLFGVAEALREQQGRAYFSAHRIVGDKVSGELRDALGASTFDAAVARGKAMALVDAVALAAQP
jgi:predicted ATPase/class 3 adenylate cyclase